MSAVITQQLLNEVLSYEAYSDLVKDRFAAGETTDGHTEESWLNYTKLAIQRMKRLDKTVKLLPEIEAAIKAIDKPMYWAVLTEGWCGDAAHIIPVIAKMAELNDNITLRLILRETYPDVMDAYLTNGGKSIPKMVALSEEGLEELGTWGPRPAPVQKMLLDWKENQAVPRSELIEQMQHWYNEDKTATIQREILQMLTATEQPEETAVV